MEYAYIYILCAPSVPINVTNVFKMILISLFSLERSVRRYMYMYAMCACIYIDIDSDIDR